MEAGNIQRLSFYLAVDPADCVSWSGAGLTRAQQSVLAVNGSELTGAIASRPEVSSILED